MTTRIIDANGQVRIGNKLVGMVDWNVIPGADAAVASADNGVLTVYGDLTDDSTLQLPGSDSEAPPVAPGGQVAVYLAGNPDGNTVVVDPGSDATIAGQSGFVLTAQFQFAVFVYDGDGDWGIQSLVTNSTGVPGLAEVLSSNPDAGGQEITGGSAATAVASLPILSQLTSQLTITSGTLPDLGSWVSGTGKQNTADRQVVVNVEFVTDGTANAATCAIAISPDNTTYTTIGTPTASVAVNTVGSVKFLVPVLVPDSWYIKVTFARGTVAASIYY